MNCVQAAVPLSCRSMPSVVMRCATSGARGPSQPPPAGAQRCVVEDPPAPAVRSWSRYQSRHIPIRRTSGHSAARRPAARCWTQSADSLPLSISGTTFGNPDHPAWDLSGQEIVHQRRTAAIRHMQKIDARALRKQRHGQVMHRTESGRAIAQLARVRFGKSHELIERSRRHRSVENEDGRHFRERRDGREVFQRIVTKVRIERDIDGEPARVAERQECTVRKPRPSCNAIAPRMASSSAAVSASCVISCRAKRARA